ncbi:MAG: DUF4286 family protein [Ferruginibacter sp.]|nr:DUF4286 family protein [Cytophagales bacterium]
MILYNVTISIENACHDEWLEWMRNRHVPDLMATGFFVKNTILRLLTEEENGNTTYAFQYYLRNLTDLEDYQNTYGTILRAEHQQRYRNRYVSFRTVLEVVE